MRIFALLLFVSFSTYGQSVFLNTFNLEPGLYVKNSPGPLEISPAALVSALPTLPAGTKVHFNAGETFVFDSLSIESNNVYLTRYGVGNDPIITGSIDVSGQTWTHDGSNTYYTTMASPVKGVLVSGLRQKQAQTNYINITGKASRTKITGLAATINAFNVIESIVGAQIVAKEFGFRPTFARTVTAYNNVTGEITYDSQFQDNDAPGVGYGFKLINKKVFINAVGDWIYDAGTSRLYIRTAGGVPTNIRAIVYDYGVVPAPTKTGITIDNITFTGQYLEGVYSYDNDNLTIQNCTFNDIIVHGMQLTGTSDNVRVTNNVLNNISNNAIHIGRIKNSRIDHNDIDEIGTQAWVSIPVYVDIFRSVGCGIHSRWDITTDSSTMTNVRVDHNDLQNIAYIPIVFTGKKNTIEKNYINSYLKNWNDGGGIYCIHRPYGVGPQCNTNRISRNIVRNGVGNLSGITAESTLHAEGIYVDNGSSYITIDSNTVEKPADYGILSNFDTSFSTVTNNTIVDAPLSGVVFRQDTAFNYGPYNPSWSITFTYNVGNVLTGNYIAAKSNAAVCVRLHSFNGNTHYNAFSSGGSSDNNRYISPYRLNVAMHTTSTDVLYTLATWKTKISADASSTDITNFLLFVDASIADIDIKVTANPTDATVVDTPGANYGDTNGDVVTTQNITAWYSKINFTVIKVLDTFTGSSGNITSHTPEKGGTYTLGQGASTINGSGRLVASSTADVLQNISNKNVTVTAIGQVSAASALSILLRYTDVNNFIQVQLSYPSPVTGTTLNLINRVGGVSTTIATAAYTGAAYSTDVTLKARLANSKIYIHINNISFLVYDDATNVNIGANNPTGTTHGVRVTTIASYDQLSMAGGF